MLKLKDYRSRAKGLPDLLPYAALVAPGVILNKDGSLLAAWEIRGQDTASPAPEKGHFPDPVTQLIDDERRAFFSATDGKERCFSTSTIFSVTYKPNFEATKLAEKVQAGATSSPALEKALGLFQNTLAELEDALSSVLYMQRLSEYETCADDGEAYTQSDILSHIQHCVSGDLHPLRVPKRAMYLDHLLASNDLGGGASFPASAGNISR